MSPQNQPEHLPPLQPPQKAVPPSAEERERDEHLQNLRNVYSITSHLIFALGQVKTGELGSAKNSAEGILSTLSKHIEYIFKKQEEDQAKTHREAVADAKILEERSRKSVAEFEAKMAAIAKKAVQDALRDQTK